MPTDEIIETMALGHLRHADVFACGGDNVRFPATPSTATWRDYSPREQAAGRLAAHSMLASIEEAGSVVVPRALLIKAHAVMRECGWHLAIATEPQGDGVLEAACTEVEGDFAAFLGVRP